MTLNALVTGARAPSSAHACRLLREGGCTVFAADSLANPLTRRAPYVHLTLKHTSPRLAYTDFRDWLGMAVERHSIDIIFPTCEEVLHLARACKELGITRKLFAPSVDVLLAHHDKYAFTETMRRIGITAPETRLVRSVEMLEKYSETSAQLVIKPALSRFASRALVRPSKEDLARVKPTNETPWVVQEALDGPEVCIYLVARRGQVVALAAYEPRHRAGPGAGIYFRPIMNDRIRAFATTFAHASHWNGQAAFDCIDTPDRGYIPIECNPRSTSGIHFFTDGPDFVRAIRGTGEAEPITEALQIVPAMMSYGLTSAIRHGEFHTWFTDLRKARSAMAYAGVGALATVTCMTEIAMGALRRRQGLAEATTHDIEWNVEASRYL